MALHTEIKEYVGQDRLRTTALHSVLVHCVVSAELSSVAVDTSHGRGPRPRDLVAGHLAPSPAASCV